MKSTLRQHRRFHFSGVQGIILPLMGILVMASCGGSLLSVRNPVPIEEQKSTGGFRKTIDYQLDYRYRFQPATPPKPNLFEFEGNLTPQRGLSTLSVKILFLDADGKTLLTESIYFSGFRQGAGKAKIEKRFELPPGAVSFGFSHFSQERFVRP